MPDQPPALPNYLAPNLDVLFIGINPSIYSAQVGHHFARPSNRFWPALRDSGLVPPDWTALDDERLAELGFGITNVVQRPTRGAEEVTAEEFAAGALQMVELITDLQPRAACFVGKVAFDHVARSLEEGRSRGAFVYGKQALAIGATVLFVMPSTSGRANRYHAERLRCLAELRAYLRR